MLPNQPALKHKSCHDSGEHISAKLAKEIAERHKAEAEASEEEAASKQQTITTLEDQIKSLEGERTKLRAEHNRAILTKQADDQCIIRQEEFVEKLNRQIEELKAKVAQPQVIEKEVEKVVEKSLKWSRLRMITSMLKGDVESLKEKLNTTRQKSGEELSHYQRQGR